MRTLRKRAHPSVAEEQARIVRFLADPATHGGAAVERVDTHISHIFLAGERAYKLKRALKTNFLDFSTLSGREAACRRELEVNAAVASGIYRGVLPVVEDSGALRLGGAGEAVDWVVEMNRFDRTEEFDALAEAGRLAPELIDALADVVAEMHAKAPPAPDYGGAERVGATIRQIAEAIEATPAGAGLAGLRDDWRGRAEAALADRAAQLDARRRHGFVRRCHGDLHLGNICLFEGRPTPFDALEFNEEMASTDVMYDLAFIVMDLVEHDMRPAANALLNRYLGATRDYSGVALLPLFISMRAAVRALVAASRSVADPRGPSAEDRLRFAVESLENAGISQLIAIGGLSGSGKSTIARRIAPKLGACSVLLRSDVARKRMFGAAPEEALAEAAYGAEASARVYRLLEKDAGRALRSGAVVILDATYLSMDDRRRAERVARLQGVDFKGIWLTCPPDELRRRVAARSLAGADASDATVAVLEQQLAHDPGAGDWTVLRSEGRVEETARRALGLLGEGNPRGV
jgi:aminoglycoside phosphotransferase family enzyme/predicted kinase